MTTSRIDKIVELGLKKLDTWYETHARKGEEADTHSSSTEGNGEHNSKNDLKSVDKYVLNFDRLKNKR